MDPKIMEIEMHCYKQKLYDLKCEIYRTCSDLWNNKTERKLMRSFYIYAIDYERSNEEITNICKEHDDYDTIKTIYIWFISTINDITESNNMNYIDQLNSLKPKRKELYNTFINNIKEIENRSIQILP